MTTNVSKEFLEQLLFDTFISCIVTSDIKLENFIKYKDSILDNFPLQVSSLLAKIKENDEDILSKLNDPSFFYILYMNYCHLYQLQYFEDKTQSWKIMTEDFLTNFTESAILCRFISYLDEEKNIIRNSELSTSLYNRYFILTNN